MSEELVPAGAPEVVAWKTAQRVSRTDFVPAAYRGKPEAVFAAILYGRELGIGPMQSLQSIHVIQGKPSLSPEAMRARVLAAGHLIETADYGDACVSLVGRRADSGAQATVTWTLDDAKRAGLKGGSWSKYPRAMLLARATSELCRLLFPDVIAGASYTPEELGGENDYIEVSGAEISEASPIAASEGEGSASGSSGESTRDADPIPPAPAVGKARREKANARILALNAEGVSVAREREAAGLPPLDGRISEAHMAAYEELLTNLESELEHTKSVSA